MSDNAKRVIYDVAMLNGCGGFGDSGKLAWLWVRGLTTGGGNMLNVKVGKIDVTRNGGALKKWVYRPSAPLSPPIALLGAQFAPPIWIETENQLDTALPEWRVAA